MHSCSLDRTRARRVGGGREESSGREELRGTFRKESSGGREGRKEGRRSGRIEGWKWEGSRTCSRLNVSGSRSLVLCSKPPWALEATPWAQTLRSSCGTPADYARPPALAWAADAFPHVACIFSTRIGRFWGVCRSAVPRHDLLGLAAAATSHHPHSRRPVWDWVRGEGWALVGGQTSPRAAMETGGFASRRPHNRRGCHFGAVNGALIRSTFGPTSV